MGRETIVATTNDKLDFGPLDKSSMGNSMDNDKKILVRVIGE